MASILLSTGSENFVEGLGIALAGLIIVFAVLLIICFILYGFGHIFYKKPETKAVANEVKTETPAPAAAVPEEPETNEEELVAAIMAAVSMTLQAEGVSAEGGFIVKSYRHIGRKKGSLAR